ncbi:MAG: hypothetical protein JW955_16365 [Sedimentisphaerales bacterium]|nr:hypothetical protein [Sedimentisphaerales bacterium]
MANINAKDIFKKLSFFKNNLSLLVPILIAVVALLLFIPTRIFGNRLRKTIEQQSVQTGRTIAALGDQLEEAARAKRMEPYINAYARDANQIENLIKQATLRELLSYRLFPDTNERTTLLYEEFGRQYHSGVDAMLQSVRAGVPPTDAEIMAALQKAPQAMGPYGGVYGGYGQGPARPTSPMMPRSSPYGRGVGMSAMMAMTDTQRKIFDTICREKAQVIGLYASPIDVAGYLYWNDWVFENRDAAYKDCWYWQMGYWMIEDVFTTVREMNKGSTSTLDAPVKRVMNVSFVLGRTTGRSIRRRGRTMRTKKEGENPAYVTSAKDAMTTPCTERYSNETLDVMQFDVRVIVDAKDTLAFMKQLCTAKPHKFSGWKGNEPPRTYLHNQITILESGMAPVDPEAIEHTAYKYGNSQVTELDLICEYIFSKAAYESIKPQQVKDDITAAIESGTKKR